eukprot:TRINITY_DN48842_c0_g1_i1.p3 TRINITY_DN48842_c0_g1~~TRINITY_DN48842_c0_g1_i1.p3  ORF type:complete len:126 (+),score=10.49 TRINITY_DN48842_c0_g1_i1:340-717(+)
MPPSPSRGGWCLRTAHVYVCEILCWALHAAGVASAAAFLVREAHTPWSSCLASVAHPSLCTSRSPCGVPPAASCSGCVPPHRPKAVTPRRRASAWMTRSYDRVLMFSDTRHQRRCRSEGVAAKAP